MQKNAFAQKCALNHNLEFYGYLTAKSFREKYKLYKFENSIKDTNERKLKT